MRFLAAVLATAVGLDAGHSATQASAPAVLRVGVDYVPPPPEATAFRLYTPESFDLLLAERLAASLQMKLELVELADTEKAAALEKHEVDVVLAKFDARDALAGGARIIPTGFTTGSTVSMRTDTDIADWGDLAGRTVCISRGNRAAESLARRYGARIRVEDAPAKSLVLVRTGVCDAAVHDDVLLDRLLQRKDWQKFSAKLPPSPPLELAAAVDAHDEALAEAVSTALAASMTPKNWDELGEKWARNVAFEVYLDQDAPDCH